jgi:hypothetical protein
LDIRGTTTSGERLCTVDAVGLLLNYCPKSAGELTLLRLQRELEAVTDLMSFENYLGKATRIVQCYIITSQATDTQTRVAVQIGE